MFLPKLPWRYLGPPAVLAGTFFGVQRYRRAMATAPSQLTGTSIPVTETTIASLVVAWCIVGLVGQAPPTWPGDSDPPHIGFACNLM